MLTFFTFWVQELWGSMWMALIGTALIYSVMGVMARMSWQLLTTLLIFYFVAFGVGFFGLAVYLPLWLFSASYFIFQIYKFLVRE